MKKIKIKVHPQKKVNSEINNKKEGKFKTRFKKGSIGEKILTLIMLILVGGFTIFVAFFIFVVITAPNFDIEKLYTKEASIVVDSAGNEIARLGTENREKVSYDQLPEDFIDALIATEDSRFFQHNGLDMARFLKATLGQVLGNSGAGGASTLTMQVVKQRYTDTTATGIKGIIRKFTDIYMAVFKIEKNYTKEQIIEFYVNIPYLGGGSWGIEQASETYFGKPVGELTLSESALLAGLFQAPNAYDPFTNPDKAEARRNQVLNLMQRHGYITEKQCELAKKISVTSLLVTSSSSANVNQGFIDTVVEEVKERTKKNPYTTPMKIYSTMIQAKQDVINNLNNGSTMTWPDETIQTGIAVTDVKTGALVAVGAGRNRKGELSYNYATMINRHPGSTAKPIFDYGPAIEYLNYSTGTTIVDDQYTYSNGAYIRNWDNSYKGIMTVKTALAASRNIPALQTFQALSQDQVKKFVTGLGITCSDICYRLGRSLRHLPLP
jgi:penicillin-binding protein 1A